MIELQHLSGKATSFPTKVIRVVLGTDHLILREGMCLVLRQVPDILVVEEVEDGAGGIAIAAAHLADVIVVAAASPDAHEIALRPLLEHHPTVRVLVLALHGDAEWKADMPVRGTHGFLATDSSAIDFVAAIRTVASGTVWAAVKVSVPHVAQGTRHGLQSAKALFVAPSGREQSVVRMVANGCSGAEIAESLAISTKTVDAYKQRVQQKLGVSHRTEYVKFGLEAGLRGLQPE